MSQHATVVVVELLAAGSVNLSSEAPGFAIDLQQITAYFQHCGALLVKTLEGQVLAVFQSEHNALLSVLKWMGRVPSTEPTPAPMPLRAGACTGTLNLSSIDVLGDAVNVAFRLSQLAGPGELLADLSQFDVPLMPQDIRCSHLGSVPLRGRELPCDVYQFTHLTPDRTADSRLHTALAQLDTPSMPLGRDATIIQLRWQNQSIRVSGRQLPVRIGRSPTAELAVDDPRVSRTHVVLDWQNEGPTVLDVSSFGTWVRWDGHAPSIYLRRESCALYGQGELLLGAQRKGVDIPAIGFEISAA